MGQLFRKYKPLLKHLIIIIFTYIYQYFHQNTINESFLTLVVVKIFIPKVKMAVLRIFCIFGEKYVPQSRVEMIYGKIPLETASVLCGAPLSECLL